MGAFYKLTKCYYKPTLHLPASNKYLATKAWLFTSCEATTHTGNTAGENWGLIISEYLSL